MYNDCLNDHFVLEGDWDLRFLQKRLETYILCDVKFHSQRTEIETLTMWKIRSVEYLTIKYNILFINIFLEMMSKIPSPFFVDDIQNAKEDTESCNSSIKSKSSEPTKSL